jgi:tetratricopeptide (TPR) repeat protein
MKGVNTMRLRNKSIDELLDLEEELRSSIYEGDDSSLINLIVVYEELYRKISLDIDSEFATSLEGIHKRLISYLIRYGTYLKMVDQKDDGSAISSLRKAVRYDRENPIAYYRLGFLTYKQRKYVEAISLFKNALHYHPIYKGKEYRLNDQQLYNAHLYLTNSALHIAEKTQRSLEKLSIAATQDRLPNLEISALYELIQQNEGYLLSHAFTIYSNEGMRKASKDECERLIESQTSTTLILYFSDRTNSIHINGREETLSVSQAEMLRYFLLKSNEVNPATRHKFFNLYDNRGKLFEMPKNTYIQNVNRLKAKLRLLGVPSIIETKNTSHETGYYFNQELPFMVMYRSDDIFLLD